MITGRWMFMSFVVSAMLGAPALAMADGGPRAKLRGFEEVPVVSTPGGGKFRAKINGEGNAATIEYELSYSVEGSVTQAHIHLGQRRVNGGIVLFLCSNLPSPPTPPGTPACPGPHSGTVTGMLTSTNIVPVTTQGIAAGEIGEVIAAIRKGVAYVNVHSDMSPSGEIRGQIRTIR